MSELVLVCGDMFDLIFDTLTGPAEILVLDDAVDVGQHPT